MKPHGRPCATCSHPDLVAIQLQVAQGVPYSELSAQYGLAKSSLSRHFSNHVPSRGKGPRVAEYHAAKAPRAVIRSDSRCPQCSQIVGESTEALSPEQIVKRAERVLFFAESVVAQAQESQDARLALQGVDRCQRSIDTLAKIAGLLKPDNVTLVDARSVNIYASWPTEALEALERFHSALSEGKGVSAAIEAVRAQEKAPALPRPQDEDDAA